MAIRAVYVESLDRRTWPSSRQSLPSFATDSRDRSHVTNAAVASIC